MATPVIMPVDGSTVTLVVELLLQVPPLTELVRVEVRPTHMDDEPLIVPGVVATVDVVVAMPQPPLL